MTRLLLLLVGLLFSAFALAAININTASKEDLDGLPGIGPVKAQAIIDHRSANGPFKSIDDIKNVKGIKDGEFAKIKGLISTSGANTPAKDAAMSAPAKASSTTPAAAAAAPAAKAATAAPSTPAATTTTPSAKTTAATAAAPATSTAAPSTTPAPAAG